VLYVGSVISRHVDMEIGFLKM